MFKKSMICAAVAAVMGVCGTSFAQTVVTEQTRLSHDGDGVVKKKVIHHPGGNKTVVKKKTSYDAAGNKIVKKKVVKKKVVRHVASATPAKVTVVRPATNRVVVHREVPTSTTVIRRVD